MTSAIPSTGEVLARVPLSGRADVDAAVAAARAAYPDWRKRSVIERGRWLFGFRQVLEAHQDEVARSVTREMGKTFADARAEVGRAIEMIEAASAVPQTMQGRVLENVATAVDCETIRQPVGVCAAICPFNFPAMVPFWFLPFAIACGNTFVLKPSEQVPLTQELVFNLIHEHGGLPDGVVNLVNGSVDVVNGLLDHPDVDAISFVGSAKVAQYVYERAAANGKRVQALGGAKNFMVRDARRRDRQDGGQHPGFGIRRSRPAVHGGVGRDRRRRRCSAAARGARAPHPRAQRRRRPGRASATWGR